MKEDSILKYTKSTATLSQILQLLPILDHFDIETVRDAATAIMSLGDIYSEEPQTIFRC